MSDPIASPAQSRVSAVSFLNTVPLVWGFTNGPQQGAFDLRFRLPSAVANDLETEQAEIGIVPCAELDRLDLDFLADTGIACCGPVRSILLISRVEPKRIRTLAVDTSSRSSVMLARIVLAERYAAEPVLVAHRPVLDEMLSVADAALIIGDPALAIDPATLPCQVLDLGQEWLELTGLPMVFAVWAGKRRHLTPPVAELFRKSCQFGMERIDEIAAAAPQTHGVPEPLAHRYLSQHIRYLLGEEEHRGLALYRKKVAEIRAGSLAALR